MEGWSQPETVTLPQVFPCLHCRNVGWIQRTVGVRRGNMGPPDLVVDYREPCLKCQALIARPPVEFDIRVRPKGP